MRISEYHLTIPHGMGVQVQVHGTEWEYKSTWIAQDIRVSVADARIDIR